MSTLGPPPPSRLVSMLSMVVRGTVGAAEDPLQVCVVFRSLGIVGAAVMCSGFGVDVAAIICGTLHSLVVAVVRMLV